MERLHPDDRALIEALAISLDIINGRLDIMSQTTTNSAQALTDLQNSVANLTTVDQSAVTLLGQLSTLISQAGQAQASGVDPNAVETLAQSVAAQASSLGAAVTANTPAASTGGGAAGSTVSGGATS